MSQDWTEGSEDWATTSTVVSQDWTMNRGVWRLSKHFNSGVARLNNEQRGLKIEPTLQQWCHKTEQWTEGSEDWANTSTVVSQDWTPFLSPTRTFLPNSTTLLPIPSSRPASRPSIVIFVIIIIHTERDRAVVYLAYSQWHTNGLTR